MKDGWKERSADAIQLPQLPMEIAAITLLCSSALGLFAKAALQDTKYKIQDTSG